MERIRQSELYNWKICNKGFKKIKKNFYQDVNCEINKWDVYILVS